MIKVTPNHILSLDIGRVWTDIGNFNITTDQVTFIVIKLIKIIGIIILMYLTVRIGSAIIHKIMERQRKSDLRFTLDEKKSKTLEAILKSILRYCVYFFGVVAILTQIFGTISLTFAGIGGVAIAFGAQSLIKDIINGFFILFEDQYAVGDYINIEDKAGIVESIELRITRIRDFNGDLHIIPNGLISKVTNHSRGDIRVTVEIDVSYEEDIDKVTHIITSVCEKFSEENEDMVDGPRVLGISALKESSLTIKVIGKAKSMKQWDCEMNLRKEIKKAFDKEKIQIPYPRRRIVKEDV